MGRTTGKKANASATATKAGPKKDSAIEKAKQSIELVVKNETKNSSPSCSQVSTVATSAQVDSHIPGASGYEVAKDSFGGALSVYLNWSDLRKNHNKFYIVQVLQRKGQVGPGHMTTLYTRYGRVGVNGVKSLETLSYDAAIKKYAKNTRAKQNKGYTVIKMAVSSDDKDNAAGGMRDPPKAKVDMIKNEQQEADSTLDMPVQTLVKFFFDQKLMESSLVTINVDVKRMPLGQLSKETVLEGYKILRDIETAIEGNKRDALTNLSGKFYTTIPHNFGMKKMATFIISTMDQVKEKYDLITNLLDIQVAQNIMKQKPSLSRKSSTQSAKSNKKVVVVNPLDTHYSQLKCEIRALPTSHPRFQLIDRYVQATACHLRLRIVDCFEVQRHGEDAIFNPMGLDNKKLLWHGSRFSNFVGILSQGMRIAPPEAPRSGFLFGKGVYFADLIGKSFHYACPGISGGIGTFVLCEVALGNMRPLTGPNCNADSLPQGFHSTHAIGVKRPNPAQSETIEGSVEVPLGQIENVPAGGMGCNEFIVYNTNQIKMRYIVRCKAV